jgi:hypothetical protein
VAFPSRRNVSTLLLSNRFVGRNDGFADRTQIVLWVVPSGTTSAPPERGALAPEVISEAARIYFAQQKD